MAALFDRILLTGAGGQLGRLLRPMLARHCRALRSSDILPAPERLGEGEEWVSCDLSSETDVLALLEGVDAVVHMGGQSAEAPWEIVRDSNIVGTYNLWEAARRSGVQRIVFASSNHTIGFHRRERRLDEACAVRPDTLYGVSKVFGETLGRHYADKYGVKAFCMRIGSCFPEPTNRRMLSTWLSYADLERLVGVGLEADYHFEIVYGVSANRRAWWDNSEAFRLGYAPQDDAEAWAGKLESAEGSDCVENAFQGGEYAARFFAGEADDID